ARDAAKLAVEIAHVLAQPLRRVALRIDGDEVIARLEALALYPKAPLHVRDLDERQRADVGTVRVTEIEKRPVARECLGVEGPPRIVDERERLECLGLWQDEAADLGRVGRRCRDR